MRYIRTSNGYVEFLENDNGILLSNRGFVNGELYFQIKNEKVTFYLKDQENPWRNDVWTIDIPFYMNGVLYSTSDEASEALKSIMGGYDSTSLQAEINRATEAENALRNDLNDEISARTLNDEDELQRITALEAGKADKASAVSTALYNSQNKTIDFKNISGNVISSIDARDFIKDGMVDNVEIIDDNLVITFNTDAGKEAITLSLASIFNPNDYFTSAQTVSAITEAVSGKADTSAVTSVNNALTAHTSDTSIHFTTGDVQSLITAATSGLQENLSAGTGIDITNNVISATGGTEGISSAQCQTLIDNSISGKADTSAVTSVNNALTAHTADTSIHFTTGDVQSLITAATSGLQTTLSAGTNVQINNNVISATDTKYTAGDGISISNSNVISTVTKFWCGTEQEWAAISGNPQSNTVYLIH